MRKFIPFLSLIAFLSFIPSIFSQNSDDAIKELKNRYPILMKTYGDKLQNLQVEYIVAIDLSGSMNKKIPNGTSSYIEEVKRGIISFLTAIPDNSKISIIGFGATVRWVQIPTIINDANRSSISRVLNDLKADEGYTDLKGAVNFLEEGCSSTSTIKYLFAFTDFNNDPPATSPFLKTSWETLQQKFALISKTSLIEAFALKLPLETSSGRDLPSIRIVFPGLNVIEFDATSLQNWFSDRAGKMMEQNLWTFISKDLQKVQIDSKFNLKARFGTSGQVKITGQFDSLPSFINGLSFIEVDNLKLSGRNDYVFAASKITRDESSCTIGNVIFKNKTNPFSFSNVLSGTLSGKIITPANDEIEKLYALVSLKQASISNGKGNRTSESYLLYTQSINTEKGLLITWFMWLFVAVLCFVIVLIIFTVKNTILPYKLRDLALFVTSHTAMDKSDKKKLPAKQVVTIGAEPVKADIVIENITFEARIFGKRGCPFNLLIQRSINFSYFGKTVNLIELNGNPVSTQSFKVKLNDKITVRQGATYSFDFTIKKEK